METLDNETIELRVRELASRDGLIVQHARASLAGYGRSAVPALLRALNDENDQSRWEAARVLGEIRDPATAPALVKVLTDQNFVVRWIASEAVDALGHSGVVPLLNALETQPDSTWLRRGAYRILGAQTGGNLNETLDPVMKALEGINPMLEVPIACVNTLHALIEEPQVLADE